MGVLKGEGEETLWCESCIKLLFHGSLLIVTIYLFQRKAVYIASIFHSMQGQRSTSVV